jgi:SAM-dependent methyltransferase
MAGHWSRRARGWHLDIWKYFAIGHEHHVFCNPVGEAKIDELVELLALREESRLLDIACGKGELLVRAAKRWGCSGVGVDISPYFVKDAREALAAEGLSDSVEVLLENCADFDGDPESFDAAICLGASWIWGGFVGTLSALSSFAKPGGMVVLGEPFWLREPSTEYLEAAGLSRASFGTHLRNAEAGLDLGLGYLHSIAASHDDWDRYEGYLSYAAERYALANPDDPDVPELMKRVREARDSYLHWGRDELGWAIYLFVKEPWASRR